MNERKQPTEQSAKGEAQGEAQAGNMTEAELNAALEEAIGKAEEHWNDFLRAKAELQNMHKRSARELENAHKFALERFVADLLPVKDSLEQGLQAAREKDDATQVAQLIEGKELTLRMLGKVLADYGVVEINPQGQPFDPEQHEAMTSQPSADHPPDTVLMVLQKGYALNGRLVRPARVIVASAPPEGA